MLISLKPKPIYPSNHKQEEKTGYLMESTKGVTAFYIQLPQPSLHNTDIFCLSPVCLYPLLSLFLYLVKSSLFILELPLCFARAQRIDEAVAVKVLRLSQRSIPP